MIDLEYDSDKGIREWIQEQWPPHTRVQLLYKVKKFHSRKLTKVLYSPSAETMEVWWQKISSPSVGAMKPKPFLFENHLTVPVTLDMVWSVVLPSCGGWCWSSDNQQRCLLLAVSSDCDRWSGWERHLYHSQPFHARGTSGTWICFDNPAVNHWRITRWEFFWRV